MTTDTPLIESILPAASLPDAETSARVTAIGPDNVAAALLPEVADRAGLLHGPAQTFVIKCDLGFAGERLGYLLTLGDGAARVEKGWDSDCRDNPPGPRGPAARTLRPGRTLRCHPRGVRQGVLQFRVLPEHCRRDVAGARRQ